MQLVSTLNFADNLMEGSVNGSAIEAHRAHEDAHGAKARAGDGECVAEASQMKS